MIEVTVNGNKTVREESEIYREFVNSDKFDAAKSGMFDSRDVVRAWLEDSGYEFENGNDKIIVEDIVCRL